MQLIRSESTSGVGLASSVAENRNHLLIYFIPSQVYSAFKCMMVIGVRTFMPYFVYLSCSNMSDGQREYVPERD